LVDILQEIAIAIFCKNSIRKEKTVSNANSDNPRQEIEEAIAAGDLSKLLRMNGMLHGHFCPFSAMGVKAAVRAVRELVSCQVINWTNDYICCFCPTKDTPFFIEFLDIAHDGGYQVLLGGKYPSPEGLRLQKVEKHFSQIKPGGVSRNKVKDHSLMARLSVPFPHLSWIVAFDIVQDDMKLTGWISAQQLIHESDELPWPVTLLDAGYSCMVPFRL
jgi:hypothetical protein